METWPLISQTRCGPLLCFSFHPLLLFPVLISIRGEHFFKKKKKKVRFFHVFCHVTCRNMSFVRWTTWIISQKLVGSFLEKWNWEKNTAQSQLPRLARIWKMLRFQQTLTAQSSRLLPPKLYPPHISSFSQMCGFMLEWGLGQLRD